MTAETDHLIHEMEVHDVEAEDPKATLYKCRICGGLVSQNEEHPGKAMSRWLRDNGENLVGFAGAGFIGYLICLLATHLPKVP